MMDAPTAPPAGHAPVVWPARRHLELHEELHARPPMAVTANAVVSYWIMRGMKAAAAEAALAALCATVRQPAPPSGVRHHLLETLDWALKYERHGEFISWQMRRPLPSTERWLADDQPDGVLFGTRAIDGLPAEFVARLSGENAGELLAATHVVLAAADTDHADAWRQSAEAHTRPGGPPLIGARVADAQATMYTRLHVGPDGFTRFVLFDHGLPPDQAARAVQRVCEIEAYRMLAMLGFPLAQQEAGALAAVENGLQAAVDAMANDLEHDDNAGLEALGRLAADIEHAAARSRYRFSATRAYHQIVKDRLAGLREQRIPGLRTLGGFLGKRFTPAMDFCTTTDARISDIADRINRAVHLAQVRVENHRETSNQKLFAALAHRQKLQLHLQQTVEGLSVVAISYYALSLVGYLAKAAKSLPLLEPLHLVPEVVVGIAVLPVVLGVAWFIHRLKQNLED